MIDQRIEKAMTTKETDPGNLSISEKDKPGDSCDYSLTMQKFVAAVKALEDVVDYETGQLEQHIDPDFADINARKARGVRILNQTMKELLKFLDDRKKHEAESLLQALQIKLQRNRELLEIHLEAVGELAEMMQSAIEAQETDGTYNPFSLNSGRF